MNRDQLSEEEWLAGTRASSQQRGGVPIATTDTVSSLSIPALVDEAVLLRETEAKKRSAESTRALLALNASLSEEVDELTLKLDQSKQVIVTLLGLLNENNVDVDMEALGLEDILSSSSSSSSSSSVQPPSSSKTSAKLQFESDSFIADVLTEGDGVTVSKVCQDFKPHDKANILCARVLQSFNEEDVTSNDDMIVITGGADKRIIASSVEMTENHLDPKDPKLIDTMLLSAPVLCLDVRENRIVAGCMDGTLHLLSFGFGDKDSKRKGESRMPLTFSHPVTLKAHEKYITRVMSSLRTGIVASASSDKSLSLFRVVDVVGDGGGKRLRRLQQLFFAKGAVEAIEWAVEHNSEDLVIETLAVSVRSSPVLYYLRFVNTTRSNKAVDHLSAILSAGGFGSQVAFLSDSLTIPSSSFIGSSSSTSSSTTTTTSQTNDSPVTEQMWLYRVPLSEDGQRVDCSWKHLYSAAHGAVVVFDDDDDVVVDAKIAPSMMNDDDVRDLESSKKNEVSTIAALQQNLDSLIDKDDIDGDAKRVREALRGKHISSTIDGELVSSTSSQGYIRVGFTVIALACEPYIVSSNKDRSADIPPSSGSSIKTGATTFPLTPPLLAVAADNGACYIVRFGSNEIVRTLVGHSVGSAVSASTKVAWHPQGSHGGGGGGGGGGGYTLSSSLSSAYLAVTSESDFSIVLYSIGSGRIAKRLGKKEGGHCGSIKDVTFAVMRMGNGRERRLGLEKDVGEERMRSEEKRTLWQQRKRRMVTVSFDKRCLVWE